MLNFSSFFDQGVHSTLRLKPGVNWAHKGQWVQIYTALNVEIDRWYVGDYSSVSYTMTVEYDSHTKETINLLVVATPNSVNLVEYGRIGTVTRLANFSIDVNDSYVTLLANPSNISYDGSRVIFVADYAESVSLSTAAAIPKTIQESKFYSEYGFETANFTVANGTINAVNVNTDNLQVQNNLAVSSGVVNINSAGVGGSINNVVIGNITPRAATFTDITSTNNTQLSNLNLLGNFTATNSDSLINLSPTGVGSVTVLPSVTGSIDNMTIGNTIPRAAYFTTMNSNALLSTTGTITTFTSTLGTVTTLNSTTGNITNVQSTSITATNITINNSLTVDTITADEITINNAPSGPSKATRKDYVDATATALAIALGA